MKAGQQIKASEIKALSRTARQVRRLRDKREYQDDLSGERSIGDWIKESILEIVQATTRKQWKLDITKNSLLRLCQDKPTGRSRVGHLNGKLEDFFALGKCMPST